ncbi:MAG TPA: hypothetical protein VEV42_09120 [Pyrinomonadaceae bacterium]|nr:hypothetical protein [Pyrinomonadaceae bacterium]
MRSSSKFEDELDELFMLPLAEFTAARNSLAKQLKQAGRGDDADFVKTLAKPSVSAWAVNQLYLKHRDEFERLLATGERFRQAQTSRTAGMAGMRGVLNERREALLHLSDLATALLRDAGHNPSADTIHRITTTLEALSAYSSIPDGPRPGRLTHDVDPPGFESLASFVPGAGVLTLTAKPQRVTGSQSEARKTEQAANVHVLEEKRRAKIAAAKASLQETKSLLTGARARANSLAAAQKKADAAMREAEKQKREAERRFEKARAAWEDADQRARNIAEELEEAVDALEDAERKMERASKELDLLVK